jgi:DNA polymerase-3 subunit epsilon
LIKQLKPPGNTRLTKTDDKLVYIRCRLDIPFPILDVAPAPAAGHAVSIGPLRGRRAAQELVEQLDSLFGLRHCGRTLPRRQHPSAYGQMGRCLSPCLGDLDPNLYRRRLDQALQLFTRPGDARARLVAHVEGQMRIAAQAQQYERAAWLRGRVGRLGSLLRKVEGVLEATHARPRLVIAPHPVRPDGDALWLVGGRLVDYRPLPDGPDGLDELVDCTTAALRYGVRAGSAGAQVPPTEIDELRIIGSYLASHPATPQLALDPAPDIDELAAFAGAATSGQSEKGSSTTVALTPAAA